MSHPGAGISPPDSQSSAQSILIYKSVHIAVSFCGGGLLVYSAVFVLLACCCFFCSLLHPTFVNLLNSVLLMTDAGGFSANGNAVYLDTLYASVWFGLHLRTGQQPCTCFPYISDEECAACRSRYSFYDGGSVGEYSSWALGGPGLERQCMRISTVYEYGNWLHTRCDVELRSVCQQGEQEDRSMAVFFCFSSYDRMCH